MPAHTFIPAWETIDASTRATPTRVRPPQAYWIQAAASTAVMAAACSGLLALARGEPMPLALAQAGIALLFTLLVLLPCARVLGTLLRADRCD